MIIGSDQSSPRACYALDTVENSLYPEGSMGEVCQLSDRPILVEVAWEICQQVGGIHTVLKTKAPTMIDRWGNNYLLVGPYNHRTSEIEFEPSDPPAYLRAALDSLSCRCHYGHWLIPGKPQVVLIDYAPRFGSLDHDKYLIWKDHGIPYPVYDSDVDHSIAFGFAVAEFIERLSQSIGTRQLVTHCHEWMAGVAIPRLRHLRVRSGTVFTTHATLLGRYIASDDHQFYTHLPQIDPYAASHHYNIHSRFMIERSAAHAAHVFTTISEITQREAEFLLGRKADFILPNGLHPHRFAALHEFQNLHLQFKERIHEFVMGHFFSSYTFDLDRTLYFFTSGRFEYRNKGMDLYIESLHRLNQQLRKQPRPPTIVAFIITRSNMKSPNITSLQGQLTFQELKKTCENIQENAGRRVLEAAVRGRMPTLEELLPQEMQVRLRRSMLARRSTQWPAIVTHDLYDETKDPVLQQLRHRGLFNSPDDPVKVIYHPEFLSATSPILSLDYEQFVRGCHMGIFPSYYEPWGYTPLECLALGLPTVTTDLSGFGGYVQKNVPDALQNGILVLNRSRHSTEETIDELAHFILRFCELGRRERIALRNRAERITDRFSWSVLAASYHRSHNEALERVSREG
jgi:glycogen synthase